MLVHYLPPTIIDHRTKTIHVDDYEAYCHFNGRTTDGWKLEYLSKADPRRLCLIRILECIINARLKGHPESEARLIPIWEKRLEYVRSSPDIRRKSSKHF
jgi:hypothetical protein